MAKQKGVTTWAWEHLVKPLLTNCLQKIALFYFLRSVSKVLESGLPLGFGLFESLRLAGISGITVT